jgi:capsular polysaccharide biosynthesis protein
VSRLPTALEPLFPVVKRAHRAATRGVGAVSRRTTARTSGPRALPVRGTPSAAQTAAAEPGAVVRHETSSAEHVHRPLPHGVPEGHPFWARYAELDVPGRFVLELRDGRVVGDYAAHLTPGGLLDYETSDYYGIDGWREHPLYLRLRLPPATPVPGTLVSLATRGTVANYYHFVMDLLPRWGILRDAFPDLAPDAVVLNRDASYQRQLLALLEAADPGLAEARVIDQTKHLALRADRLLVPSLPNFDTQAPPWTTAWLHRTFPPIAPDGAPKRIWLTRGSRPHTRRVVNEAALRPVLDRFGFTVVDAGTLSVQEQIDQFAGAEVVAGPHGAAFTNLVFCSPGVRVLELFAPRYLNCCYWAIAANLPGCEYRYLVGTSRRPVDPRGRMLGVQDDINVDVGAFERLLAELV